MGSQFSSDIKYMYTNINGNRVSIPFIRLSSGQWVPLQQQMNNWYSPYYSPQGLIEGGYGSPHVRNGTVYPYSMNSDYFVPNQQAYYNGFLR